MYLAIDTISSASGITIVGNQTAAHLPLDPQNSSEGIIDAIDQALKKANTKLSDLQAVFVIKGPGSFTGLRVGISVANQFSHQLKIPIIGLRTDEWWKLRATDDATYLQSMNKEEVYVAENGKTSIKSLAEVEPCTWFGQLSDEHRAKLSENFKKIKEIDSIEETWKKLIPKGAPERKEYNLIEPFYGKKPNITKSKRQVSLG